MIFIFLYVIYQAWTCLKVSIFQLKKICSEVTTKGTDCTSVI